MNRRSKNEEMDMSLVVMTIAKANIMAYVVTAIFILFSSIILTYTDAKSEFETIMTTLGIICSAFLAGFDTAKIEKRNGYKWGAIGGLLYFILFLIFGTLMDKLSHVSLAKVLLIALMILVSSSVAGMISVNTGNSSLSRR